MSQLHEDKKELRRLDNQLKHAVTQYDKAAEAVAWVKRERQKVLARIEKAEAEVPKESDNG